MLGARPWMEHGFWQGGEEKLEVEGTSEHGQCVGFCRGAGPRS